MKEHIKTLYDYFVDYAGRQHHFTVAAISKDLPKNMEEYQGNEGDTRKVYYDVAPYIENYGIDDAVCNVVKAVYLGISICNPEDQFDQKVGEAKAIARARNSEPALLATNKGYINNDLAKALLSQESTYIKNNPQLYIKGYKEMEKAYLKRKKMEEFTSDLSEVELQIMDKLEEDPAFVEDAIEYLLYKKNQNGKNN